ncbi:hemolysin family protein [Candidatus Woesearchaeota archaeon]|nr:hemolysin family protein [Candidatus Woesearchaeota archaeon]
MLYRIVTLAVLIILSSFFSGVETALFSLSSLKVRHLVEKKRRNALMLERIKQRPHDLLTTILIGNNVVNIAASALATMIAVDFFESNVVGIVTGIMTFIILVFGEVTPKTLALRHNEGVALFVAGLMNSLMIILFPLVKLLDFITRALTGMRRREIKKPIVTEEELKTMFKAGEEAGAIKETEKRMIHKIFKFDDIDVANIMTARPYMVCANINLRINDLWGLFARSHHTKIPVYEKSKDKIKGMVYLHDALKEKNKNIKIEKIMRKAYFVPEAKKVDALLKAFQARQNSIAVVVDEHGIVSGLVTMEDILEEIVGEIVEETDKLSPDIRRVSKNSWFVLGKSDIEEVNKKIGSRFREEEDFETIGGYVLNRIGRIPEEGEEIKDGRYVFTIEKLEHNRIFEVKIKKR